MSRTIKVKWDTSDGSLDFPPSPEDIDLPEIVTIPGDIHEDEISDYLSDTWGYCHFGWSDYLEEQNNVEQ